jgi:RNA polymerase-binding transcription factor DksA
MGLSPAGKGKPAPKKPAEKPGAKHVVKPASAPIPRPGTAKPAAKAPASAAKAPTSAKTPTPKAAPILNKGALAAKEAAAKRVAEAARVAAEKAEAEAKRPRKLVPATANAIRPGAAKQVPTKGKSPQRPPAEVRPLGVLPPESMAKAKPVVPGLRPSPPLARPIAPARPAITTVRPGDTPGLPQKASAAPSGRPAKGDERLSESDLKHFETRLLEERARIMREMGHIENTILKVNPRDSAGEVGGYSFHMADAGTDSMEREISFDIASKEGRLLREIDDALRRIYNGVYGICEASGKPIARARLEALPWARYTIEEQHHMELKQRAGRLVKEEE